RLGDLFPERPVDDRGLQPQLAGDAAHLLGREAVGGVALGLDADGALEHPLGVGTAEPVQTLSEVTVETGTGGGRLGAARLLFLHAPSIASGPSLVPSDRLPGSLVHNLRFPKVVNQRGLNP